MTFKQNIIRAECFFPLSALINSVNTRDHSGNLKEKNSIMRRREIPIANLPKGQETKLIQLNVGSVNRDHLEKPIRTCREETRQQAAAVWTTCCAVNVYLGKHEKVGFLALSTCCFFFKDLKVKFCSTKLKNAHLVVSSQPKAPSLGWFPGGLAAEQQRLLVVSLPTWLQVFVTSGSRKPAWTCTDIDRFWGKSFSFFLSLSHKGWPD